MHKTSFLSCQRNTKSALWCLKQKEPFCAECDHTKPTSSMWPCEDFGLVYIYGSAGVIKESVVVNVVISCNSI